MQTQKQGFHGKRLRPAVRCQEVLNCGPQEPDRADASLVTVPASGTCCNPFGARSSPNQTRKARQAIVNQVGCGGHPEIMQYASVSPSTGGSSSSEQPVIVIDFATSGGGLYSVNGVHQRAYHARPLWTCLYTSGRVADGKWPRARWSVVLTQTARESRCRSCRPILPGSRTPWS